MENIGRFIKSAEARKYIYAVAIALIPLLVAYGIISEDNVDSITILIGAVLGLGTTALAVANTPTKEVISKQTDKEIDEVKEEDSKKELETIEESVTSITTEAITELGEVKLMLAEIIERLDSQEYEDYQNYEEEELGE